MTEWEEMRERMQSWTDKCKEKKEYTINFAKVREKMKKFDVSLSTFSDNYEKAVTIHARNFVSGNCFIITDEVRYSALEDADMDLQDAPWQKIEALAEDFDVMVEMGIDKRKEDKNEIKLGIFKTIG